VPSPAEPATVAGAGELDGLRPGRRRIAYLALATATTMAVLDGTIANTALPTIAHELHASPTASIWVVNGFQLAVTAALLPLASLGTIHGATRVYRAGVIAFVVASLACALSRSLPVLVIARVLQGFGAAGIMAIAPAILRDIFPKKQLGRALGINALVVATSSAAGPTLGGFVLAVAHWSWIFALNVPIGLVNIALNRTLPSDTPRGGTLDLPSVVTSAAGLSLAIWALDGFSRQEPRWSIGVRLAVAAVALVWFVRRQFVLPKPMVDLDLFGIRAFSAAAGASWLTFTSQGLAYVALPFYFQESLGRSPLESGLLLTSWPLAIAVVAPVAGRLADRYPPAVLATIGLAIYSCGLAFYATLPPGAGTLGIVLRGVACGVGFGFFQSPNNREFIGSAPRAKTPSASGLLAIVRVSGQTLGATLVAIVFGAFGAEFVHAHAVGERIARAVPFTLSIACAAAIGATVVSALRLRPRSLVTPEA